MKIKKKDKRRKAQYVFLPSEYLNEATGVNEGYREITEGRKIRGDTALCELLGVSTTTLFKWKRAGIVKPYNPRPRIYIYDLKQTLAELRANGYMFDDEI